MKFLKIIFIFLILSQIKTGLLFAMPITGFVVNADKNPIEFVTVVAKTCDSVYINAVVTDSLGRFTLNIDSNYNCILLELSHIAYITTYVNINSNYNQEIIITLQQQNHLLSEVIVKGNWIVRRDGNIVVDVSQLPGSKTMQADKMLQHLPGIMKTKDGYELNGRKATIYINGIKQNITSQSLNFYLNSLPADMLSEIELVALNSGKYEATNETIIDIRTKKNIADGYSLQYGASSGFYKNGIDDVGGNIFYMIKKGRFLFHNILSYSDVDNFKQKSDSTHYVSGNAISNHGLDNGRYHALTYQSSLTYNLPNEHKIDFRTFIYYDFGGYQTALNTKKYEHHHNIILENQYIYKSREINDMWAGTISYTIPSKNKKFGGTAYYTGMYGGLRSKNNYYFAEDLKAYQNSEFKMTGSMHTIAADGESNIARLKLQYGIREDYNQMNDIAEYNDLPLQNSTYNSLFKGREIISAGYMSFYYNIAKPLSIRAGIRLENTNYELNYKSINKKNSKSYTDIFPNLLFYFNRENYNAIFGLTSGISRPSYHWLIPGKRQINEYYYSLGNPDIEPTIYYSVVLNNTLFKYFYLNLRYSRFKNVSGGVYANDENGLTYMTYLNYADIDNYSAHITLPYRFMRGKLYGQIIGNFTFVKHHKFKNDFIVPFGRNLQYYIYDFKANFQYDVTDRFSLNSILQYTPEKNTLLTRTYSVKTIDFNLTYSLLKDKNLIFGLEVLNMFSSSDLRQDIFFLENFRHQYNYRKGPVFIFSVKLRLNKGQKVVEEYKNVSPDFNRLTKE